MLSHASFPRPEMKLFTLAVVFESWDSLPGVALQGSQVCQIFFQLSFTYE